MSRASTEAVGSCDEPVAPLRWGLAGCGDLARRLVGPALSNDGRELAAVWGRSRESAEALALTQGIAVATDDLAIFFAEVDAVYVATPVLTHVPLALASLLAGRHVLVEKPLNIGLAPLEPLLAAVRRNERTFGVAYYRRLSPVLRRLKLEVEAGTWGDAIRARVAFASPFNPAVGDPKAWRLRREEGGGGVLADAGSHRIDLLLWLFGRPSDVRARLNEFTPGGCERVAELELRWPSGLNALCRFEWSERPYDRLAIEFPDNHVTLDPLDAGTMTIVGRDGVRRICLPRPANPYVELVADFERAVAVGTSPQCPLSDALAVDDIILAAMRSEGKFVQLGAALSLP